MPFTPFHFGPGVAAKAVLGRHFSFTVYAMAQVVIDLDPLVRLIRGDDVKHGPSHTFLGAVILGLLCLVTGRPITRWCLKWWPAPSPGSFLAWLRGPPRASWIAVVSGAFIGAFGHIGLDSIMHTDMQPLWPFAEGNSLLDLVSMETLHLMCAGAGVVGLVMLVGRYVAGK